MNTYATNTYFGEKDFELLAQALDAVSAEKRELFLTKLVILLATNNASVDGLDSFIRRALANMD